MRTLETPGRLALALALALCFAPLARAERSNDRQAMPSSAAARQAPSALGVRHVDVVLALDTSSSMNGLIDSARQKLWDVVTTLEKAQPQPILRVGLISYGNTGYDARAGWVRTETDLTSDLDTVYGKLFGLTTHGGDEYVARAVQVATSEMSWAKEQDALRMVFVAGNESAEQDPSVRLVDALAAARQRGIYVNAIFCGSERSGDAVAWARTAELGKGRFVAIDQNRVVAVATPQDAELRRLGDELNKTYVAYGAGGAGRLANQAAQDRNAESASAPAAASRAVGKASALYRADDWDLVDAAKGGKRDVSSVPTMELPEPMRAMAPRARVEYVEQKAKEREAIKRRIQAVNSEREKYVVEAKKKAATGPKSMDDALLGGIRSEAEAAGFKF